MNIIESIWNNCNDTQFKYTCFQDPSRGKQCSSNGILDCVKIPFALQHRQDTEAEIKRFSNLIVTTQLYSPPQK